MNHLPIDDEIHCRTAQNHHTKWLSNTSCPGWETNPGPRGSLAHCHLARPTDHSTMQWTWVYQTPGQAGNILNCHKIQSHVSTCALQFIVIVIIDIFAIQWYY